MNVPSPSDGPSPAELASCAAMRVGLRLRARPRPASCCATAVAERGVLGLLRARRGVARARCCCAASSSSCVLLVGRGGARLRRPPASASASVLLLRLELVLQLGDAARVVLALVGDALEVVLALDELTGAVGRAEQADHRGAVAVRGRAAPRSRRTSSCACVELLLRRLDLRLQDRAPSKPSRSTCRLGGGQPVVGGVEARPTRRRATRRAAAARPGPATSCVAGRLLGGARPR